MFGFRGCRSVVGGYRRMYIHRVWVCAGMSMHSSQVWGDGTEGCVYLGYSYFGGHVFMGWGS